MTEPSTEEIQAEAKRRTPWLFSIQASTGLDLSGRQAMRRSLQLAEDALREERSLPLKWTTLE